LRNMSTEQSHRPRAKWQDYKGRGIYLITLVVQDREHLLGELNMDPRNPAVILSETGHAVVREWENTIAIQAAHGRKIDILATCAMPDHFHGVIFVKEDMDVALGTMIQGFKSACTREYRRVAAGLTSWSSRGATKADESRGATSANESRPTIDTTCSHISVNKRLAYYASLPRSQRPLFDPNYDDSILYKKGQLKSMIEYVRDNPRRAIIRKLRPDLFRSYLHIKIDGRDYSAFGNLFLLRFPDKEQVFFHRYEQSEENLRLPGKMRKRYEDTEEFAARREELIEMAKDGAVLVNPGISMGERILKDDCFGLGLRMIHIQKEPIGKFWKPEKRRFDICAQGNLLILAPLDIDAMGAVNGVDATSNYAKFHNINTLAKEITEFYGKAVIVG